MSSLVYCAFHINASSLLKPRVEILHHAEYNAYKCTVIVDHFDRRCARYIKTDAACCDEPFKRFTEA